MDIYDRLTRMLTPLGGQLVIDAFMDEAERGRRAQRPRAEEPPLMAQVAAVGADPGGEAPDADASLASPHPEAAQSPRESQDDLTDTGRLRLEVAEFMSRENAHDPAADEIQEYMKERSGFDPSEMK